MITDDEINDLIDLQEAIMSVNESNIRETVQYFLTCPFISDSIGYEKISRAFHLALTYHPLSIPSYIQLIKSFQQEKTLQTLKYSILHLLFHYLKNMSAFPSECGSLSFIYRSFLEDVYTEDDIFTQIQHFYETGVNFQLSLFWIFAYFTPIIEKKSQQLFELIIGLYNKEKENKIYLSTISLMLQNCFQSYFDQLPLFLSNDNKFEYHKGIVLQFGTMADIIRRDSIDELKQKASHPLFSIDQTISVSLFEPVWFLFDEPTLIQYSAFHHSLKCFNFCQMMDADLHLYDNKNKMLSQFAVAGGNVEIIRRVEQLGCSFNDTLHVAICYFWFDIFVWLHETKDVPLSIDDPVYGTILSSAAASGNIRGVQYCIEKGIDVSAMNSLEIFFKFFF